MPVPEPLRLRVQITKTGPARYLSHTEFSRALLFAARRSGLRLEQAGAYRARIKMSLSPPIPIGVTSECELVDFKLIGYVSAADAQRMLNASLPTGLEVVRCRLLPGSERPVGKLIDTATYRVSLPEGAGSRADWERAVTEFLAKGVIEFKRVQPRKTRMVDLRGGVHRLQVIDGEGGEKVGETGGRAVLTGDGGEGRDRSGVGDGTGDHGGVLLSMVLDDGTSGTIKPWEVVEVLAGMAGVKRDDWVRASVHRDGLFARRGDRLVSPMELGRRKPAVSRAGRKMS
jgi:radical SAM-linked protein